MTLNSRCHVTSKLDKNTLNCDQSNVYSSRVNLYFSKSTVSFFLLSANPLSVCQPIVPKSMHVYAVIEERFSGH